VRMVLAFLVAVVVLSPVVAVHVKNTSASPPERQVTYIVEQGDTLWGIAAQFAPHNLDRRVYIYKIRKLNDLTSPALIHPGQALLLPIR